MKHKTILFFVSLDRSCFKEQPEAKIDWGTQDIFPSIKMKAGPA